ncbi:helix-turn-helix domain-containing protein [Burkholderia multivorans]|uniref:helix-turn-helix domain-containing protein n=1 Tax=Burkholderia multivorans TaxID=87883 RepID=UPI001C24681D|nr:helix-turn-helix domain-containing protein [Burkholderia multivorans]MBU9443822.1 helix-turn-helix domain-containing protein [Burkholderia multivorans]
MTTQHVIPVSITTRGIEAVLPTDEAAAALNRKPQTLRKWACLENGPLRPVRINGRLAWRVSEIQALLNGEA